MGCGSVGSLASPTIPMFIGQGANGTLEGTPGNKPGIGRGDGVMVAGDVRTLARDFCASGTAVDYAQYHALSHISTFPSGHRPPWPGSTAGSPEARHRTTARRSRPATPWPR